MLIVAPRHHKHATALCRHTPERRPRARNKRGVVGLPCRAWTSHRHGGMRQVQTDLRRQVPERTRPADLAPISEKEAEDMSMASLVLSCIGPDRAGLVGDLTSVVAAHQGNILESRMAILGGEFAIIMRIDVPTARTDALAEALDAHGRDAGLTIHTRATQQLAGTEPGRLYRVRADTMDHPGIVQQVANFFARQGCNITQLETDVWAAPHTGTPMFTLDLEVTVPASRSARALREAFDGFCTDTDLDAVLESVGPGN